MIRVFYSLAVGALAVGVFLSVGPVVRADDDAAQAQAKPADTAAPSADAASPAKQPVAPPAAKPKRELSPALANLRDVVRQTLAAHQKQPFNTQENSATEIMNYCLAFGCNTEVVLGGDGQRVNGITCLCWNYPCAGFEMLGRSRDRIAARVGYGYQERPGEFLAMLALSRVPATYPVRVGKTTRTVADLVEAEKLAGQCGTLRIVRLVCRGVRSDPQPHKHHDCNNLQNGLSSAEPEKTQ